MTISIIIPVYNGERVIGKCLEALKTQDYKGQKETIVVDDGSTDSTAQVVKGFKDVTLVRQENNGPAAARNNGIRTSGGSILLFTDSDCVPEASWVSEMAKPFKDPGIAGVQGAYKTAQTSLIGRFSQIEIEDRYERLKNQESIDWVGTYSAAYRRGVLGKGFDESFPTASGEDPELSFRVAKENKIVFNPDAIVFHTHTDTLGKYLKTKFFRAYWRVPLYKKHKGKIAKDSYTPQLLKAQIGLFYLFFISLIVSVFLEPVFLLSVLLYIIFVLATIPFSASVFKKNKGLGIAAVGILQLRSIVFGLGMAEGLVRGGRK